MILSLPRINYAFALVIALVWTTLSFGAALSPAPAYANDHKVYYTAKLAQPAAEGRAIAGGVAWVCKGTTCVAPKASSRPLRVCRELQRDLGEIAAFTAKGEELAADELAACNK